MRDEHEDCQFWGLTRLQCAHHHMRLADLNIRRTKIITDRAMTFTTRSARVVWVLVTLAVGLALLDILS